MSNPLGINQYTKGGGRGLGAKKGGSPKSLGGKVKKVLETKATQKLGVMSPSTGYTSLLSRGETAKKLKHYRNERKRLISRKLSTSQVDTGINNILHASKKARLGR